MLCLVDKFPFLVDKKDFGFDDADTALALKYTLYQKYKVAKKKGESQ